MDRPDIVDSFPIASRTLQSWENMEQFIADFLNQIRANFMKDGYLYPFSLVVVTKYPPTNETLEPCQGLLISGPMENDEDKERLSQAVRRVATQGEAILVFFASEAWSLAGNKEKVLKEIGHVAEHPEREEIIIASFEHRQLGARRYVSTITRDEHGKGTAGEFTLQELTHAEGRFVDLPPPPVAKGSA